MLLYSQSNSLCIGTDYLRQLCSQVFPLPCPSCHTHKYDCDAGAVEYGCYISLQVALIVVETVVACPVVVEAIQLSAAVVCKIHLCNVGQRRRFFRDFYIGYRAADEVVVICSCVCSVVNDLLRPYTAVVIFIVYLIRSVV